MTKLQELRKEAKERGLKGYSTLCMSDLQLLLAGEPIPKRLRKNQVSVGTQTALPICNDCARKQLVTHLRFKADVIERRKIAIIDDMEVDVETGEVLGCEVEYSRYR